MEDGFWQNVAELEWKIPYFEAIVNQMKRQIEQEELIEHNIILSMKWFK